MSQDIVYVYSDASFSHKYKIAIIGHFFLFNNENEEFRSELELKISLEQINEINNIRAEIRSVLRALAKVPKAIKIVLYTDCEAICKLPSRRDKLEKTNFISQRKSIPLNNADLYTEFFNMMDLKRPELIWVKGHSRHRGINTIEKNFSFLDQRVRKQLRKAAL